MQIIYNHILSSIPIKIIFSRSIRPTDGILIGITTPGESGPVNIGNKGVLHTSQISKTGALPSNAV